MASKSTKAEKEARVNRVYDMLLIGLNRYQILQNPSVRAWGVTDRQVDTYIGDAYALLAAEAEYYRGREIGKAKARLELVIKNALIKADFTSVLSAQRELNKLFSLYEPEAPKTLRILGMDEAELRTIGLALQRAGLRASDVFTAMLNELATVESEAEGNE